jgi:hypothetical protein
MAGEGERERILMEKLWRCARYDRATALAVGLTLALVITVALLCARRQQGRAGRRAGRPAQAAAGRVASILQAPGPNAASSSSSSARRRIRLRMVHHGAEDDEFWRDVQRGVSDASRTAGDVKVEVVGGLATMVSAMRSAPSSVDGLIFTCPYDNTDERYRGIDEAVSVAIAAGLPCISFNTDTFHNPKVFQYVGSSNKDLGERGAQVALSWFPELGPGGGAQRRVSHIVGILQEHINVTLDWRITRFHWRWSKLTQPFAPPTLVKVYSAREAWDVVQAARTANSGETVMLVPTGLASMPAAVELLQRDGPLYACQVGDTGERVSALLEAHNIPFVGQMQYTQGFATVTSMVNLMLNYNGGVDWSRKRGNAALTVDATYECTHDCGTAMDPLAELGHKDRSIESPWTQMGVSVHLEGLDISRWDEYRRDRIGCVNKVVHHDGSVTDSVVVDGAANFGAAFAADGDPTKRVYEGMLGERLRYSPLFERRTDTARDQYEYFVLQDNGARVPLGRMRKVMHGDFVRSEFSSSTFRIMVYAEESATHVNHLKPDRRT